MMPLLLLCGLCEFIAWSYSMMPFGLKLRSLSFRGFSEKNQGGFYDNLFIVYIINKSMEESNANITNNNGFLKFLWRENLHLV